MPAELLLKRRRPRDELEAQAVVDHGEPAGGERQAPTIGSGNLLARGGLEIWQAGLGRQPGSNRAELAASRALRQSVRVEEQRPSRRGMAPMPPVPAARPVSARMRGFSWAVKVRRRGRGEISGDGASGGGTTAGLRPPFMPAPDAPSIG